MRARSENVIGFLFFTHFKCQKLRAYNFDGIGRVEGVAQFEPSGVSNKRRNVEENGSR